MSVFDNIAEHDFGTTYHPKSHTAILVKMQSFKTHDELKLFQRIVMESLFNCNDGDDFVRELADGLERRGRGFCCECTDNLERVGGIGLCDECEDAYMQAAKRAIKFSKEPRK